MNRGELARMNTKQLRCTLYDCRDRKFIPYKYLLPTGIWKMKKFDLIELIMTLEYFIPTEIVVQNKYDKVNKQLLLNYLDSKLENGSYRLRNKNCEYLSRMLPDSIDSHYDILQYAISNELRERVGGRSILRYVNVIDIKGRLKNHLKVIDEIWSLDINTNYWFTLRNPWRPY